MLSRHFFRLAAAAALALPSLAMAQGAAKADCARLTALGAPQPVWLAGAKSAPGEEALLTLLNYQMALSLCHQEEIIRLLKSQTEAGVKTSAPTAAAPASALPSPVAPPAAIALPLQNQVCSPSSTAP